MSEQVQTTIKQAAPWRKGVSWWLVLTEGIVALALGIYLLVAPEQASAITTTILSIYLIVAGLMQIVSGMRYAGQDRMAKIALIRGITGLVAGLLVLFLVLLQALTEDLGRILLATGSLVYGGLGLYVNLRGEVRRWGLIINSSFFVVLALVLFFAVFMAVDVLLWVAVILIAIGLALGGYGIALYRAAKTTEEQDMADSDVPDRAEAESAGSPMDSTDPESATDRGADETSSTA